MVIAYHGTLMCHAIEIARAGAVYSPLYEEIEFLKSLKDGNPASFKEIVGDKDIRNVALKFASDNFSPHMKLRLEYVSLSVDLDKAWSHADKNPSELGVVFGFEINDGYQIEKSDTGNIFVRDKVGLDCLSTVLLRGEIRSRSGHSFNKLRRALGREYSHKLTCAGV